MPKTKVPEHRLADRLRDLDLSYERAARYLAERGVEISGSYLWMLARGLRLPSLPMAKKLAAALGISLADVAGE